MQLASVLTRSLGKGRADMKPLPVAVLRKTWEEDNHSELLFYRVASFVGICAILYFAQEILIPIAIAVLFSILLTPVVRLLMRGGIPKTAAIITVVLLVLVGTIATTLFVGRTLTNLAADLPRYETSLREKARSIKLLTSKGVALEKAAQVIEDLQVELEKKDPALTPAADAADQNRPPFPSKSRKRVSARLIR